MLRTEFLRSASLKSVWRWSVAMILLLAAVVPFMTISMQPGVQFEPLDTALAVCRLLSPSFLVLIPLLFFWKRWLHFVASVIVVLNLLFFSVIFFGFRGEALEDCEPGQTMEFPGYRLTARVCYPEVRSEIIQEFGPWWAGKVTKTYCQMKEKRELEFYVDSEGKVVCRPTGMDPGSKFEFGRYEIAKTPIEALRGFSF